MIVQPTPTNPRSPVRRALRIAGLALPVILLGAVVGAGLLGPKVEPPPPAPSPQASAVPRPTATPGAAVTAADDDHVPPATVGGLPVEPVEMVLARRDAVPPGVVVAVDGYLRVDEARAAACVDGSAGGLGPWCERSALLAAWWRASDAAVGPFPPHLHVAVPAGVRLPEAVLAAGQRPAGAAHVVVIGRFGLPPAGCPGEPSGCEEVLVAERVVWVNGTPAGLTPLVADALQAGTKRANPFSLRLDSGELPLSAVVVWPDTLARIDAAAAALAAGRPPGEPVTYMRFVEAAALPGAERRVRWRLLADADLGVLGSGRSPAEPPAFPTVAADLRVLSVPQAAPVLTAGGSGPLAVAGYLVQVRPPDACPAASGDTRRGLSPLCERTAQLVVASPDAGDAGARVPLRIPPGVRLPDPFEHAGPVAPMPVVVVGRRAADGGPCAVAAPDGCETLVADLVAWADGRLFDPGPVFDAGLALATPSIAYRRLDEAQTLAIGWSGTVLVAAIVRPRTVAVIDPEAASAMAAGPEAEELVWYVRGLETAYDPSRHPLGKSPPRLSWAVIDEVTGRTLARGTGPVAQAVDAG
jgi:hypothetical protein